MKKLANPHMRVVGLICCILLSWQAYAQRSITGKVYDEKGQVLPGVNVILKNTTVGTTTTVAGGFTITVPDDDAVLVFSFVGYEPLEMTVGTQSQLEVTLQPDVHALEEVVVIGYGTQRRTEVTSSVASVKKEDFLKGAVRDAAQLVQGKIAGLRITTPSGAPNANTQINLRGVTSINGSSEPLILIDGVPGSLNTVAPEDIASIDVLKDGSAAAIYGTRATGGVILITTRQKSGDTNRITYDGYVSVQTIARRPELFTGDDYRQLINEGESYTDYGYSTDWLDAIMQTPFSHNHNLTFQGGNTKTNLTGALNYRNWEGIFLRSGQERFTMRLNLNHAMFDNKLHTSFQIINRITSAVQEGSSDPQHAYDYVYRQAMIRNPTDRIKTDDGAWQQRNGYFYENPVSLIYEATSEDVVKEMRMNGTLNYTPTSDIDLRMMVSHNESNELYGYATTFDHTYTWLNNQNATASRSTEAIRSNLMELIGTYSKQVDGHQLGVLVGYSWQDQLTEGFSAYNWDFPTDGYGWNNLGAGGALAEGQASMSSYKNKWQLVGFFGRLTYSWQDKYLLMASVRREGSSKFGVNSQWGTFPAVSVGWRLTEEAFMKSIAVVSNLKLRAGFGVTGTIAGDPYLSQISYAFTRSEGAYIGGEWVQGFVPARNFNPDLRWERKEEFNVGVDFGFFNDRLGGSIDVYRRTVRDLLYNYSVPVPPYLTGYMMINAGVMRNEGLEVLLNAVPVRQGGFEWQTALTYSTNRNKLVSLSNDQFDVTSEYFNAGGIGEPVQDYSHRVEVGSPIGQFYVWKTVGVADNGEWLIENPDGEQVPISEATQEDRQFYGNGIPRHLLGWNNTIRYKNVDLTVNMRGAFGHDILNFQRMFYENPIDHSYNHLNNANDPVYGKTLDSDLAYVSYYIEKGDYLKIDNVTVGYNLPTGWSGLLQQARVYVSALNLATITGYKGIDPEGVSYTGSDTFNPGNDQRDKYPTTRTFTAGVHLTF